MKDVSDVPFAVGSDGTIYVNVTHLRGQDDPEALLERALAQGGAVLIGVELDRAEVRQLLERLDEGAREAVAFVLGARLKEGGRR